MQALSSIARARAVLVFILAAVCCVAWTPIVFAQEASDEEQGSADSKAMLILDASSSMLEEDADGPRIDAAKQASKDLIESLPPTAQMGLMVYGSKVTDAPENHETGCKDIETLAPVGDVDKDKLVKAINGVTPKGYTPMGNSLRAAADELGDKGQRSIILVSDGIDTCAPPPVCEVAEELASDGVDLAIHTVGFKVDDKAREELECIAEAGNGQFLEADDAGSLAESLKFLSQRDVGKYKVKGTEFEFADNPEDAKWLGEGQYQTKVKPDRNAKKDRYFRVSVPEEHDALITITPVWQTNGDWHDGEIFITTSEVTNEGDSSCGEAKTTLANASNVASAQFGIDSYHIALKRDGPQRFKGKENRCDMSNWLIGAQVYQNGDEITEDVPIEISVFHAPLPDEEQAREWDEREISSPGDPDEVPEISNSEPINGGTGFNDAVEISEGSYSDKIVPGEYRFYKIPVKWGERPVIKAKTPKSVAEAADSIKFGFYNPTRGGAGEGSLTFFDETVEEGPVSPSSYAWQASQSERQGYYFVWFGMGSKGGDYITGVEQPYEFAVALDGEPADGGLDWQPTYENGPEPSDESINFDSAKAEDSGSAKDDGAQDDGAAAVDDESGKPSWVLPAVIGAGVLLLALIGLLVFLLRRNKKNNAANMANGAYPQQNFHGGPQGPAGPGGPWA